MQKKRIILIGLLLLTIIAGICIWGYAKILRPQSPNELLNISRRATRDGDYPKALNAILNFYDLSFRQDSYTYCGVRASFAIEIWKDLNSQYPMALDKMKEIRDSKENNLRSGDVSDIPFDPVAIVEKIHKNLKT